MSNNPVGGGYNLPSIRQHFSTVAFPSQPTAQHSPSLLTLNAPPTHDHYSPQSQTVVSSSSAGATAKPSGNNLKRTISRAVTPSDSGSEDGGARKKSKSGASLSLPTQPPIKGTSRQHNIFSVLSKDDNLGKDLHLTTIITEVKKIDPSENKLKEGSVSTTFARSLKTLTAKLEKNNTDFKITKPGTKTSGLYRMFKG